MGNSIKDKANEISLMLVMTSEGDAAGVSLLLDLCKDLADEAKKDAKFKRIVDAAEFLSRTSDSPGILSIVSEFVSASLALIEDAGDVHFPNESIEADSPTAATNNQKGAAKEKIDEQFIGEYIETHSLLLEEFESALLDYQNSLEGGEELQDSVKRYIHNLKGDSGSIGITSIERVCHALEDLLVQTPATELVSQLLVFKQWAAQCLESYAEGNPQPNAAESFLSGLKRLEVQHSNNTKTEAKAQATSAASQVVVQSDDLGQYALTGEKEILLEFAAEAEEHLNNVESVILDSEGAYTKDAIDTIFRGVHSIKGGSAYFSIEEMTKCSHILENFLSEVRDGKRSFDHQLTSLLLVYIDLQKNVLNRCKQAVSGDSIIKRSAASIDFLSKLDAYGRGEQVEVISPVRSTATQSGNKETSILTPDAQVSEAATESKGEKLNLKTFVKVDTARLDLLIDSIGEMVIYSSMLIRQCRELLASNESVMNTTHQVEKFSRDLQDIGMSMRLVPIKGLFQKMSRLVWDTSKKLGKDVVFSMEGEDTELDRNLIDKLADPLMHMVRNSLDHGIESPEEREKKGKPRNGKVKLSACHSGGSIHIKIQDDGKGLNPEKLLAKALERGIIQENQKLSESEINHLIFAAGFSTAAVVTDISGRGVGMDVVRGNVESLRGRIHIQSKVDQGSTFTIEIPLTLAIIDGIQVNVGSETFIIPSLSIIEFVRPTKNMISCTLDRGETFHFRNKYLPIYRIADLYGFEPKYRNPLDATLVVVESNQEQVALMVDHISGECSTVIKSLGSVFEEGKGLAGCAIMPEGNVALILDVSSLITLARRDYTVTSPSREDVLVVH